MLDVTDATVQLSAAVYGKYPSCKWSVGQDWKLWQKEGLVDLLCPMDYSNKLSFFKSLVKDQISSSTEFSHVWPGIGVTASESRLGPVEVLDQIESARKLGAQGVVLFDLDVTLLQEILPVLQLGASKRTEF